MSGRRRPVVVTCSRGTEDLLADEIGEILPHPGDASIRVDRGAVHVLGTREDAYRLCLWSRIASRVLVQLATFDCPHADALYDGVRALGWRDHLDPTGTLAVDFVGTSRELRNSQFGAMVTKDAIVDRIRGRGDVRPSVDLDDPDVRVNVHLRNDVATVAIDLAGDALHRRGDGGRVLGPAPLKETLAAAIVRQTGWAAREPDVEPFVDPMCGSGTLLLEAAAAALDRAPGLGRRRWGFMGWRAHDAPTWKRLKDEAADRAAATEDRADRLPLYGSDVHPEACSVTQRNAARAGVAPRLARRDVADLHPPKDVARPGVLVTNPPYGERLGAEDEIPALYRTLGDVLKQRFAGWTAWILAGSPDLAKHIGLKASARIPLRNGPLDCRLVRIDSY